MHIHLLQMKIYLSKRIIKLLESYQLCFKMRFIFLLFHCRFLLCYRLFAMHFIEYLSIIAFLHLPSFKNYIDLLNFQKMIIKAV